MEPVASFIVITGNKWMTKWMQACDVYESFKVFAYVNVMNITYKEGENVDLERAGKQIPQIIEAIEKSGNFPVLVHLDYVLTEDALYHNQKLKVPYYRNENVKVISEGQKWYMLDDFIEKILRLKLTPTHDENSNEKKPETGFKNDWQRKPYKRS